GPRAAGREIGGGVTHFWRVANAPRGGAAPGTIAPGNGAERARGCRLSWDSPGSLAGWPDERHRGASQRGAACIQRRRCVRDDPRSIAVLRSTAPALNTSAGGPALTVPLGKR